MDEVDVAVPTMKVTLLVAQVPLMAQDNYLLLANALRRGGHQVGLAFIDRLSMQAGDILAEGHRVDRPLVAGEPFTTLPPGEFQLDAQDLIWMLGLGLRSTFLDKLQLLAELRAPLINSVDALLYLKSKYRLPRIPGFNHPETHASCNWRELHEIVRSRDTPWIAKPPAGSHGRDVFKLHRADPNCKAILQHLTGPGGDQFCLLQEFVPAVADGEKRILFAGGRVVGQYLRRSQDDHRTNLSQGGQPECCELTTAENELCQGIGAYLVSHGAWFAAMDLVYPHIIEFNVVNPGGLATLLTLTGIDLAPLVVDAILGSLAGQGTPEGKRT